MSLMLDFLSGGGFLSTMAMTLFIFRFLDQLVMKVKFRNRLLRVAFAALNGALAICILSFHEKIDTLFPTAVLVLFLDVCYMIEYIIMSKDELLAYTFLGSAVFFNHFMIYVLVYSVFRFIPHNIVSFVQYQRIVFILANLLSIGVIILYRLPFFPVKEIKLVIHSSEKILLNIWFPVVSSITFLNTMLILPAMEGAWLNQSEWLDRGREIAFYTIIAEWALLLMSSSYLVVFYQAGRIGAKDQADHRSLTRLFNRRAWEREVMGVLAGGEKGYLVMLDLDHFKEVNDNLGHPEGDWILKETADMLRQTFRDSDIIGHIGGDEFCVFLVGDFEKEIVEQRLKHFMSLRRKEFPSKNGGTFWLSVSAGYAAVPDRGEPLDKFVELVARADAALYWQKEHGRDGFVMFQKNMSLKIENIEKNNLQS